MFLYFGIFAFFLSVYMFTPIFIYYVTAVGGNYLDFGVIISLAALSSSLLQPYIGYLSDRRGVLRIIVLGCSFIILSLLLTAVGITPWHLIILYILLQIGLGIVVAALYNIASNIKFCDKKSFIPYYRSIQGIGVIIGPILGGAIANISLKMNVIAASLLNIFALMSFLFYFSKTPNTKQLAYDADMNLEQSKENDKFVIALKHVILNKSFLFTCILFFLLELAFDCISLNTPMIGEHLKTDATLLGIASSAYFITFTLLQVPINNFLNKLKVKTAFILMGVLSILTSMLFLIDSSFVLIIAAMGLSGMTIGSLFTYCTVVASKQAPDNEKGLYLGVFNTIMPLTDTISPIMVAFLFGFEIRLPFVLTVCLLLVFVLVALFQRKTSKLSIDDIKT